MHHASTGFAEQPLRGVPIAEQATRTCLRSSPLMILRAKPDDRKPNNPRGARKGDFDDLVAYRRYKMSSNNTT